MKTKAPKNELTKDELKAKRTATAAVVASHEGELKQFEDLLMTSVREFVNSLARLRRGQVLHTVHARRAAKDLIAGCKTLRKLMLTIRAEAANGKK